MIEAPIYPELEFEEKDHIYRLNGLVIPSVSEVMTPLSSALYKSVDPETLNHAAARGTSIHEAIENWIKFGIEDIIPDYKGYLNGFYQWWAKEKPTVVCSELKVYHKVLLYGGTVDLLAYIGNQLTLVDFKTTSVLNDMTCKVQVEAYAQALASDGIKVDRKIILHLVKDGTWDTRDYPAVDGPCWRVFSALKTVFDYIKQF